MNKQKLTKQIIDWLTYIAVFSTASAILGFIKIPAPIAGSIALDSAPGYFVAGFINPVLGGIIGSIGHLASAFTGGFPLGGQVHLIVAFQMFFFCSIFGLIVKAIEKKWGLIIAVLVVTPLNGILAPYLLGIVGALNMEIATSKGMLLTLSIVSLVNILLAALIIFFLSVRKIDPVNNK